MSRCRRSPIPILIGGHAEPALRRAARLGDGWMHAGGDAADARALLARLRELRREYGREREPFESPRDLARRLHRGRRPPARGPGRDRRDRRLPQRRTRSDTQTLQHKLDALRGFAERVIAAVRR